MLKSKSTKIKSARILVIRMILDEAEKKASLSFYYIFHQQFFILRVIFRKE